MLGSQTFFENFYHWGSIFLCHYLGLPADQVHKNVYHLLYRYNSIEARVDHFHTEETGTDKTLITSFEIHYFDSSSSERDDRPIVVLLHGIGSEKNHWVPLVSHMSRRFRYIGIDLPGFGDSSKYKNADYSFNAQAQRLSRWLEKKFPDQTLHIVGHSMGGQVAATLVAQNEKLHIESLVILAASGIKKSYRLVDLFTERNEFPLIVESDIQYKNFLQDVFHRKIHVSEHYLDHIRDKMMSEAKMVRLVIENLFANFQSFDSVYPKYRVLHQIDVPTLVLNGEADRLFDATVATPTFKKLIGDNAEAETIPDCGHGLIMECRWVVGEKINDFYNKLENTSQALVPTNVGDIED